METCPTCSTMVIKAESVDFCGTMYHPTCAICQDCGVDCISSTKADGATEKNGLPLCGDCGGGAGPASTSGVTAPLSGGRGGAGSAPKSADKRLSVKDRIAKANTSPAATASGSGNGSTTTAARTRPTPATKSKRASMHRPKRTTGAAAKFGNRSRAATGNDGGDGGDGGDTPEFLKARAGLKGLTRKTSTKSKNLPWQRKETGSDANPPQNTTSTPPPGVAGRKPPITLPTTEPSPPTPKRNTARPAPTRPQGNATVTNTNNGNSTGSNNGNSTNGNSSPTAKPGFTRSGAGSNGTTASKPNGSAGGGTGPPPVNRHLADLRPPPLPRNASSAAKIAARVKPPNLNVDIPPGFYWLKAVKADTSDICLVEVPEDAPWEQIIARLARKCGLDAAAMKVWFVDEDGDHVVLSSWDDLEFLMSEQGSSRRVRVFVGRG